MTQIYYRFHDVNQPSREEFLESYIYIIFGVLLEFEQDMMIRYEQDGVPIDYLPPDIPFR